MFTQRTLRFILLIGWLAAVGTGARSQEDPLAILHNFSTPDSIGSWPRSKLVQTPDGSFYGTCSQGGPNGTGTIFKFSASSPPTLLYSFSAFTGSYINADGAYPRSLTLASDGNLYGYALSGGSHADGTLYKITSNGAFTLLYTFSGNDGAGPRALVQGADGNFYGITVGGGANGNGTVFKMTPAGALTALYSFSALSGNNTNADGANPYTLVQGADGNFYGTANMGGANGDGTVFKITPTGTFTTLHSFTGTDGAKPQAPLLQASDGNFYSVTYSGGANDTGVVYKITPTGTLTDLHSFPVETNAQNEGVHPDAGLTLGSDGNFYGATSAGGANDVGTIYKVTPAGAVSVIHTFALVGDQFIDFVDQFSFNNPDGVSPLWALTLGSDGYFYGTAMFGGSYAFGTIFKVNPSGDFHTLYAFSYGLNTDGGYPVSPMLPAGDHSFFGTTYSGGTYGQGAFYHLLPGGVLTTLYSFRGPDGSAPAAQPVPGPDGNFYGTTEFGGAYGYGTIYKIGPSGAFTLLHSFTALTSVGDTFFSGSNTDGVTPTAPLVVGPDGNVYGIAPYGGSNSMGTVFKSTSGGVFSVIHAFASGEGANPTVLILGPDGNLYGGTRQGGANGGGTVFKMTLSGTLTTLYSFSGTTDGSWPDALAFGPNGNLYGTTQEGGSLGGDLGGRGTFFKLTPSSTLTTLSTFGTIPSPVQPMSLVPAPDGGFFGYSKSGGAWQAGNIFHIMPDGSASDLYNFYQINYGTLMPGHPASPGQPRGITPVNGGGIFGTTTFGGQFNFGTIYRLDPPRLLLRNPATGQLAVWYFQNNQAVQGAFLSPNTDSAWRPVGTADFNGDGQTDILFQNPSTGQLALWYMVGNQAVQGAFVSPSQSPDWRAVGAADFNNDGQPDILFQNGKTGQLAIWYMNNNQAVGAAFITPSQNPAWKAVGVAGGLGYPVILFQNSITGQLAVWYMNNNQATGGAFITPSQDPHWQALGLMDLDRDGNADILFKNSTTGQLAVWYMNNNEQAIGAAFIAPQLPSGWQAVAPYLP